MKKGTPEDLSENRHRVQQTLRVLWNLHEPNLRVSNPSSVWTHELQPDHGCMLGVLNTHWSNTVIASHRPNLPPTIVSLMAVSSVTAFDRGRPVTEASSMACSRPLRNTLVLLRQPETVPLSLGTHHVPPLRFPALLET